MASSSGLALSETFSLGLDLLLSFLILYYLFSVILKQNSLTESSLRKGKFLKSAPQGGLASFLGGLRELAGGDIFLNATHTSQCEKRSLMNQQIVRRAL
jgi:hypothetical protein